MARIAIVGAGVSGLVCAARLHPEHEVTVFEAEAVPGGHAATVRLDGPGPAVDVDTGFVVYNETTYPRFTALLSELGVATRPTVMSFSVRSERTGLEYAGSGLGGLFAQRRNLLRPRFWGMLRDVVRFNREAPALLERGGAGGTLDDLLESGRYGRAFAEHYLLPMGAAIWSAPPERMRAFPAAFFIRFFRNHGLLGIDTHLPWRTVAGGAQRYVAALSAPFASRIRRASPVVSVRRLPGAGVEVVPLHGPAERFDEAVLAVHADQALQILEQPTQAEHEVLAAFPYVPNETVLHTDASLLPRRAAARASWNYHVPASAEERVVVTYDMTRLQGLPGPGPLLVSLNAGRRVDPRTVLRRMVYAHPVFTAESPAAQARHGEISGADRIHYCGAYWGYGFHEDGVRSGEAVAAALRRVSA